MGYTIYWSIHGRKTEGWQNVWPQFINDANLIIEAADVLVCGPPPDGIDEEEPNEPRDESDNELYPPICDITNGIWVNGVAEDGHEPFILSRAYHNDFCKTLEKPYDQIVGCLLLRAYHLLPEAVNVSSDGRWQDEWLPARRLYSLLWPTETIVRPPGLHLNENKSENWQPQEDKDAIDRAKKKLEKTAITSPKTAAPGSSKASPLPLTDNDATAISSWLSNCESDACHQACQPTTISWQPLPGVCFRLIDVKRRMVVRAPLYPSFAALSYVWGGNKQPELNSASEQMLMQENGVDAIVPALPDVINDAMEFCKMVGIDYLWVDALCIKQDSTKDVKLQMRRMRGIYASARVTIVAAAGDNANVRLIPSGTQSSTPRKSFTTHELARTVSESVWFTRAWTYQELNLSHRVIFCVPAGLYLVCQREACNVSAKQLAFSDALLNKHVFFDKPATASQAEPSRQLHSYLHAVEQYSNRSLTYTGDALNAFQGIMQSFKSSLDGIENTFYFGMPTSAFDQVFCFRTARHNPKSRRKEFPSWSWAAWAQPVTFDHEMLDRVRTWNMIHPARMKSSNFSYSNSVKWETSGLKNLWRPLETNPYIRSSKDGYQWGFPTASDRFRNCPDKECTVSIADLRIASDPFELSTDGASAAYYVFPTRCDQAEKGPPPKMISFKDFMQMPLPKLEWLPEEAMNAPLLPLLVQTFGKEKPHFAEGYHDAHQGCNAEDALGAIWLDKAWRDSKPKHCIMGFIAICGVKENVGKRAGSTASHEDDAGDDHDEDCDQGSSRGWTITKLMLTEKMGRMDYVVGRERVHTMDCKIDPLRWKRSGAEVISTALI